jgi:hypothetical protein
MQRHTVAAGVSGQKMVQMVRPEVAMSLHQVQGQKQAV